MKGGGVGGGMKCEGKCSFISETSTDEMRCVVLVPVRTGLTITPRPPTHTKI